LIKKVVGVFFIFFLLLGVGFSWAKMPEIAQEDWVSISGEIDETKAEETITALLNLEAQPETSPVGIRIFSSGGSLTAVMAICDVIRSMQRPVVTVALGEALSGAALILSSGDIRYISEHSIIMLHQPNIVFENWSSSFEDLRQLTEALNKVEDQIYLLLAENTGKTKEQIKKMLEKEMWFTPEEAIEFGLADELLKEGELRIKKKPALLEEKKEKEEKEPEDSTINSQNHLKVSACKGGFRES